MNRMEELERLLNSINYERLWHGFSKRKYAIYNEEKVYINDNTGIEMDLVKEKSYFVGKRDERFIGNSIALIGDEYIAIFNVDSIPKTTSNLELAPLIIHEMFHCFQMESGEKRYPNDLLGIDYPITVENIRIRTLEREYLLEAAFEQDKEKKLKRLRDFFNLRNKREKLLGDMMDYEKAIESLEGAAVYVEYKARNQLNKNNGDSTNAKYIDEFTKISEENLKIRYSSYIQGLLLGLIADEFIENWNETFLNSELFLSDFLKETLKILAVDLDYKYKNIDEIEKHIHIWNSKKDILFEEFNKVARENIMTKGFQVIAFDPMNMIKRDNEVIHKNFLKVKIGESEKIIKGPVKAKLGESIFDVKSIIW